MIDLHTHILCGIDDGARDPEQSVEMLRAERDQGVDTVVLTPHFYRDRERPEHFFQARDKAMQTLQAHLDTLAPEEQESLPKMILAAEVAWRPNMHEWDELERFCIEGTGNMLLELPFAPWGARLCDQLYAMMNRTGITPILAHVERYVNVQSKSQVSEILSLGLPVQITANQFSHFSTRGPALKALKTWAHVVATDCHDMGSRKPDLRDAMDVVGKKLGEAAVDRLDQMAYGLTE